MDPVAGLDEHEDFFQRYDAEQVSQAFPEPELEAAPQPPSADELARAARFRKPVALLVGAMTLLSLTALALRGAQPSAWVPSTENAQHPLVAHYAAALAAPPVAKTADAPTAYEPVAWEATCAGPSMCLLDPNADSAWLSLALAASESRDSALSMASVSIAETRHPILTSSLGARFSASVHLAPAAHVEPASSSSSTARTPPRPALAAPLQAAPIAPTRIAVATPPHAAPVASPRPTQAAPPQAAPFAPARVAVATSPRAVFPTPQTAAAAPPVSTPVARFPDAQ